MMMTVYRYENIELGRILVKGVKDGVLHGSECAVGGNGKLSDVWSWCPTMDLAQLVDAARTPASRSVLEVLTSQSEAHLALCEGEVLSLPRIWELKEKLRTTSALRQVNAWGDRLVSEVARARGLALGALTVENTPEWLSQLVTEDPCDGFTLLRIKRGAVPRDAVSDALIELSGHHRVILASNAVSEALAGRGLLGTALNVNEDNVLEVSREMGVENLGAEIQGMLR